LSTDICILILFKHPLLITFNIGKKSDGSTINQDLCTLPNLFISYQTNQEFNHFINYIISGNLIYQCLIISKQNLSVITTAVLETYIYDNPEEGTILNRNTIFSNQYNSYIRAKKKKQSNNINLIIIDDIWQVVPKLKNNSAKQFKQLLNEGSAFGFHFIIGSSMPYRNLLLQLMIEKKQENKSGVINQLGAEMIFNPDGLIFFRERNDINFNTYYP